jgi:hypothetical protein
MKKKLIDFIYKIFKIKLFYNNVDFGILPTPYMLDKMCHQFYKFNLFYHFKWCDRKLEFREKLKWIWFEYLDNINELKEI